MKHLLLIILLGILAGCSILGANIDDELGINGDGGFTEIGFEIDTLIIKSIFLPRDALVYDDYDYIACNGYMRQVCTASKGCWCEKNKLSE
jgi:hypothetical protein